MTITAAVTLSLYRIDGSNTTLALFATFSVVNSIYCSVWDLFMDFSFLQPDSRNRFLRDILAIKRRWMYYVVMVVDPILRFGWIFYAIYTHDKQHSSVASFLIGFAEVTRRGMWALFRVENEHCSNVAQYKASRDVPLPYKLDLEPLVEIASDDTTRSSRTPDEATATAIDTSTTGTTPRTDEHAISTSPAAQAAEEGGLRRRRKSEAVRAGGSTIRRIIADAHRQDFEKKRRPAEPPKTNDEDLENDEVSDEEEEDDDDDDMGSALNERMEARKAEHLIGGSGSDTDT